MSTINVRRKPFVLVLLGLLSMLSALFVLAQPASAHSATIQADLICTDTGELKLLWTASSFSPEGPFGLHPDIVVDFTTDTAGTDILLRGAFTDENGRQLTGAETLVPGTSFVEVRVTPAPGVKWSNSNETGGGDKVTLTVPPELQDCGSDVGSGGGTPTPAPTEEPTPEPTVEPTPEPTEEPTPEPTVEPTPEPTVEPTPEPTEEPTPEPTPEPTEEPTTVVLGPEPEPTPDAEVLPRTETRTEALAETGVESVALTIAAVALLLGGAMVTFTGVSLARRQR